MPPKKDKKRKRVRKARAPRVGTSPGYGNFIPLLSQLKGDLMRQNIPVPGVSSFTPFYGDQAVNQVRAQASNTIQRIQNETNRLIAEATQKQFEKIPLHSPGYEEIGKEIGYGPESFKAYSELSLLSPENITRAESVLERPKTIKKMVGRPKGSKNKPKSEVEKLTSIKEGIENPISEEYQGFLEM